MPIPWAMIGISVATSAASNILGGLMSPRPGIPFVVPNMTPRPQVQIPQISGVSDQGGTITYGWAGQMNSEGPGLPVPLLGGKCRVGMQLINHYVRSTTSADELYALYAVCEGEVDEVVVDDDEDNIWLTEDLKLKELGGSWDTALGTKTQDVISEHEYLHQIHEVRWSVFEPVHGVWHFDSRWYDDSTYYYFDSDATTNAPLLCNGNATIEAVAMKFGDGCAEFPGASGDYLSTTGSPRWHLGGEDFTIECWIRHEQITAGRYYTIIKWQNAADDTGWSIVLYASGATTWYFQVYSDVTVKMSSAAFTGANDTWYHLSVNRYGGAIRIYVDGVDYSSSGSYQGQWLNAPSGNPDLTVGLALTGIASQYNWYGYIDDLKFVRGQCLRKGAFTAPTAAIPETEYSESTIVRTKGKCHEVGFTFSFPNGLYDTSTDSYSTSMAVNMYFRDTDWTADEWGIIQGRYQDGVNQGRLTFTGGIEHGFKRQYFHRMLCVNYDDKDPSGARFADMKQLVGETTYVTGLTSGAEARIEYDYATSDTTGVLYLQMMGSTESFVENETLRIRVYTNTDSAHTGANDQAVMTKANAEWPDDIFVGLRIDNETDGSTAVITSNTADTVTGALGGGAENLWDTGDDYLIYYDVVADAVPTGYEPTVAGKVCYLRKCATEWRISRYTSPDYEGVVTHCTLDTIDEILHESLRYPNTALFSLNYAFLSSALKQIGPVSVLANRGTQSLPTWPNGTAARDTSIPAWFCLDVLTGVRYGKGLTPADSIDETSFDAWEAHTEGTVGILRDTGTHTAAGNNATVMTDSGASFVVDEHIGRVIKNITDGSEGVITDNDGTTVTVAALSGGTDDDWDTNDVYEIHDNGKRARWNGIIDSKMGIEDAVNMIGRVGRARVTKIGETRYAFLEKTGTSSHLFTAGNIVLGSFARKDLRLDQRPHGHKVWFLDEDKEYNRKFVLHKGPEYETTTEPLRVTEEFTVGVTNSDEAMRLAILSYQLEFMPSSQCVFTAGEDALRVLPGDIATVIPDSPYSYGGRVVDADADQVIMDARRGTEVNSWDSGYIEFVYRDSATDTIYTAAVTVHKDSNPTPQICHPLPDTAAHGNGSNGGVDDTHKKYVDFVFEGYTGDVKIYYELYNLGVSSTSSAAWTDRDGITWTDRDGTEWTDNYESSDDVEVLVNGVVQGVTHTPGVGVWQGFTATLLNANVNNSGVNILQFAHVENRDSAGDVDWGVRNVRIENFSNHGGILLDKASGSWTANPGQYEVCAVYHKGYAGNPSKYPTEYRILECVRSQDMGFKLTGIEYCHDAYFHPDYGSNTEL